MRLRPVMQWAAAWKILWLAAAALAAAPRGEIRVQTEPEGATILCNGIVYDPSPCVITNLDAGMHLIAARKAGFGEARMTVRLESGRKMAVDLKLDPITGLVLVHARPSEADIEIDGAHRGTTPLLLTDLPLGRYRVKATATGYLPREIDLRIADRTPRREEIVLVSDSAQLAVDSQPQGAAVTIDGVPRGATPCNIDRVPAGTDIRIEVTADGYAPVQQTLKLAAGDRQKVHFNLKPLPAKLSIVSEPPGARVYVAEQFVGEAPVELDKIEAGTRTVRVELKGYETETRAVEVKNAETRIEEFRLNRNSGILEIATEPGGVRVVVDGEERGVTKMAEADAKSDILKIDLLSQGEHRLQLQRKGFYPLEKTFLVEANKTVTLTEKLRRKFTPDTLIRLKTGETRIGVIARKLPGGDVELETKPGIFVTIRSAEIVTVEPVDPDAQE